MRASHVVLLLAWAPCAWLPQSPSTSPAADRLALQSPRYGELSIDLVSGWRRNRMDETLRLIAGGYLETLPLITHHFPVAEAAEAWKLIESKAEPVLGVILDW